MRTLLNEPWAIAMILPQIIHEEPCRGAMELKGKVGGGVGWGGARKASRSGPQPEWSEGWEVRGGETGRDPSDKCVWNRKEIPHYLQRWQACVCVHICACVCICMCLFLESHLCYYIWKKRHCGSVSGVHHNRGMCVRFLWRHALFVCVCVCARWRRDGVSSDFSDSREAQSVQLYKYFFVCCWNQGDYELTEWIIREERVWCDCVPWELSMSFSRARISELKFELLRIRSAVILENWIKGDRNKAKQNIIEHHSWCQAKSEANTLSCLPLGRHFMSHISCVVLRYSFFNPSVGLSVNSVQTECILDGLWSVLERIRLPTHNLCG